VARDEAARVLQPGKQPFDLPAALIASERPAVLGEMHAVRSMRRNELNAVGRERLVEPVAVIGRLADQARGRLGPEARVQRLDDELRFVRRSRGDGNGERKTSAVCNRHDLGPLAPLGFADVAPFFLALAKEPSMNVSLRSRAPRACRSAANALSTWRSVPLCT